MSELKRRKGIITPRLTIIGLAVITGFALTGCVDDRDFQYLKNAHLALSNETAYLKARITAVEEACIQINTRLVDAECRKSGPEQPVISKSGSPSEFESAPRVVSARAVSTRTTTEHAAFLAASQPADDLTRGSFARLVGMTVSEVLTMLGKPDSIKEDAGCQNWNYNAVRLRKEDGGEETSPALVVFEQSCVTRAELTEAAQPSPAPEEK